MKQTAMCWGIECGDGWYMLLDVMCHLLQWDTDHNNSKKGNNEGRNPQIEVVQVKEKWGELRFYTTGYNDHQSGIISFAESMSHHICENCGSTDDVQETKTSWIRNLCKKCRETK
jgi:hypothetical protein